MTLNPHPVAPSRQRDQEGQGLSHPEPSLNPYFYEGPPENPTKTNTGDSYWTHQEIVYLRENYPRSSITAKEIADTLSRTVNAVRLKASRLGIKKDWEMSIWE